MTCFMPYNDIKVNLSLPYKGIKITYLQEPEDMCLLLLDKSNEKLAYVNNSYVMYIYSSLKQIFCKHLYIKELLMHDLAVFTSYLY